MFKSTNIYSRGERWYLKSRMAVAIQVTLVGSSSVMVFHCRLIFAVGKWIGRTNHCLDDWMLCSVRSLDLGFHVTHVAYPAIQNCFPRYGYCILLIVKLRSKNSYFMERRTNGIMV